MIYRPVKELDLTHADIYIDGESVGLGAIKFADGYAEVRVTGAPPANIRCTAAVHVGDDGVYTVRLFRLLEDS